jgi:hypothetical protein
MSLESTNDLSTDEYRALHALLALEDATGSLDPEQIPAFVAEHYSDATWDDAQTDRALDRLRSRSLAVYSIATAGWAITAEGVEAYLSDELVFA